MTELEKYKLSTYETVEILRQTEASQVQQVRSTLDDKLYIKKIYPADKRDVFQIMAQIKNAHIPQIYEVFFGESTIIVEQYIAGASLAQLLEQGHVFAAEDIYRIFFGLSDALAELHDKGLIHRDIKPENIIITQCGEPVLVDYSISRIYRADRGTDTEYFGTVGYAAPEQYGFSQSDERTDIYALGMTMKRLMEQAPKHLRSIAVKCCEFDPARRFETAEQLRAALEKGKRRKRRHFVAALCAAAGLLLCLLCLLLNIGIQAKYEPVIYDPEEGWLIDIYDIEHVGGLQIPQEGTYQTKIDLETGGRKTQVAVERVGDVCRLMVDGEERLVFTGDDSLSTADYPECRIYAELIFYDLDADGILEIIPVVSHARYVQLENGIGWILRNYTLAWCVYFDGQTFRKAQGKMVAQYDTLQIHDTTPNYIWGDFPCGYKLVEGELVQVY